MAKDIAKKDPLGLLIHIDDRLYYLPDLRERIEGVNNRLLNSNDLIDVGVVGSLLSLHASDDVYFGPNTSFIGYFNYYRDFFTYASLFKKEYVSLKDYQEAIDIKSIDNSLLIATKMGLYKVKDKDKKLIKRLRGIEKIILTPDKDIFLLIKGYKDKRIIDLDENVLLSVDYPEPYVSDVKAIDNDRFIHNLYINQLAINDKDLDNTWFDGRWHNIEVLGKSNNELEIIASRFDIAYIKFDYMKINLQETKLMERKPFLELCILSYLPTYRVPLTSLVSSPSLDQRLRQYDDSFQY